MYGAGYKLVSERKTHDLNHNLTFYCTHNQLCAPQYTGQCLEYLGYITLARVITSGAVEPHCVSDVA